MRGSGVPREERRSGPSDADGMDSRARKATIAAVFDRSAPGYAEIGYFPKLGERLAELARLGRGARVLDVACGRGAVLFPAAERIGPEGSVTGIDLSETMARETAAEIERRELSNASVLTMDAESLRFPDSSMDVVTCAFALFFFPHLERALAEIRRVLVPGGQLAVSTWGADDPGWDWLTELRQAYGAVVPLRTKSLDRADDLRAVLEAAGFSRVRVTTEWSEAVYADGAAFWRMLWSTSGRAGLEALEPPELARFTTEVDAGLRARMRPDGLHELLQVHYALAVSD